MEVQLTADIASNILQSLTDFHRLPPPVPREGRPAGPSFGSVFFGKLNAFAKANPHFFMVRKKPSTEMGFALAISFSPITSKGKPRPSVLTLPQGTLPPKHGPRGERWHVVSYVLLRLRLIVDSRRLSHLRLETKLDEELCLQARQILKGINNGKAYKTKVL